MVPQYLSEDLLYFLVFVLLVLAGEAKGAKRCTRNYIHERNFKEKFTKCLQTHVVPMLSLF